MKNKVIGVVLALTALTLLLLPSKQEPVVPPEPSTEIVSKAFDSYESLWRKHAVAAAEKIEQGELTTETEVWEFLSAGQEPARRVAFDELAKKEQEVFTKAGGWTAELHSQLLRSYAK